MQIDVKTACEKLNAADNILILTHQRPDGDTLGAAFALLHVLIAAGKKARVSCHSGFPARYGFLSGGYAPDESFSPEFTVAVDVASLPLLCDDFEKHKGKIDMCIDHHKSNSMYAKFTLLDTDAAAACEIVYELIKGLGGKITTAVADAIFAGITTDTGCFKYSNVTARTHEIAADMIRFGANHAMINKIMFDTKSRGLLMVEQMILKNTKYYFDGRCAVIFLPSGLNERYQVLDDELDGISSFPARIAGVVAGVTIKASEDLSGKFRVSVRTASPVDASKICLSFGGGGHANAAGCTLAGTLEEVTEKLLAAIQKELESC